MQYGQWIDLSVPQEGREYQSLGDEGDGLILIG